MTLDHRADVDLNQSHRYSPPPDNINNPRYRRFWTRKGMAFAPNRWMSLSLPRRFVSAIMRACRGVPLVTAERRMELGELVQARQAWQPRPLWSAIFIQAFAAVADEMPVLRRSLISFPWPHLYQHERAVACVVVEREYRDEQAVFFARVSSPHAWHLAGLDAYLRRCKNEPVDRISSFRAGLNLARAPWPLRSIGLWLGLRGSGRLREQFIGTFCLSSPAAQGAGMINLLSPLTTALHYSLFDSDGRLDMRLTFDHRVLDGGVAARALVALEKVLHGPVLNTLRQPARVQKAA
jgi:hypothetical protein